MMATAETSWKSAEVSYTLWPTLEFKVIIWGNITK